MKIALFALALVSSTSAFAATVECDSSKNTVRTPEKFAVQLGFDPANKLNMVRVGSNGIVIAKFTNLGRTGGDISGTGGDTFLGWSADGHALNLVVSKPLPNMITQVDFSLLNPDGTVTSNRDPVACR